MEELWKQSLNRYYTYPKFYQEIVRLPLSLNERDCDVEVQQVKNLKEFVSSQRNCFKFRIIMNILGCNGKMCASNIESKIHTPNKDFPKERWQDIEL